MTAISFACHAPAAPAYTAALARWSIDRSEHITWVTGPLTQPDMVGKSLYAFVATWPQRERAIRAHARALSGEPVSHDVDWDNHALRVHLSPLYADNLVEGVTAAAYPRDEESSSTIETLRGIFRVRRPLPRTHAQCDDSLVLSPDSPFPDARSYLIRQLDYAEAAAYMRDPVACELIHANHGASPAVIRALLVRKLSPPPGLRLLQG